MHSVMEEKASYLLHCLDMLSQKCDQARRADVVHLFSEVQHNAYLNMSSVIISLKDSLI